MLELILALLNDPSYQEKDVSEVVCPKVSAATLQDIYQELEHEAPQFEVIYSVQYGYQNLSF